MSCLLKTFSMFRFVKKCSALNQGKCVGESPNFIFRVYNDFSDFIYCGEEVIFEDNV